MPSPFETAAAMTSAAVDTVYGETEGFQVAAMKAGADVDAVRVPDSARATFTAIGAYVAPSKAVFPDARPPERDNAAHQRTVSVPLVSIDNAKLPWPVAIFDRITRLKTGEVFEVAKALPDGVRRTIFHLTARKRT